MKLKELLDEIKTLHLKLKHDNELIEFYEEQSLKIPGPVYGKEKVDVQPSGKAPFEKWVFKKLDKEQEMKETLVELENKKIIALNALETLNNKDLEFFILYRFVSFMRYEDIINKMHYSRSTIYRLKAEAKVVIETLEV